MTKGHGMQDKLQLLKDRLAEVTDLAYVENVLDWDQQTYMPPGGAAGRAEQWGTISKLIHEKMSSDEMGQLLADAQEQVTDLPPDADDARLVSVSQREYARRKQIPTPLMAEFKRTTAAAHTVWAKARAENDFKAFQPLLEKIFDLKRQMADCFPDKESIYDPLLDEFEPEMKASQVREVFAGLKRDLVPLVKAITARPEIDDTLLHRHYDEQKQWDYGLDVIRRFGYDFTCGRQDKAAHPFTSSFSLGDVRITTRVHPNLLSSGLLSTMHECGHALYDQGLGANLARSPLANGASLGVHESQSRLWENLVGRSRGFWKFFYPRLQATFPEQLQAVNGDTFYRVINKVKPSFIRVEADEVTYNLHTMLRFELEVGVLEGTLAVKDLPAAWNAKVRDYLGLDVPDDSVGVLQDVHWSSGYIGYFPTYTLGNIASVQFFQKACQDMPMIPADLERGEFQALLTWLRDNIHRHGRKFTPTELIQRVTGSPLNAEPYVNYLKRKYTEIYGL
jgi:carboxypeptidase Taq